jgi:hypothetical protein
LKAALKRGVETGTLVQVKNSYKVSPQEKAKKKPAVKKAAPAKKTAVTSKVSWKEALLWDHFVATLTHVAVIRLWN